MLFNSIEFLFFLPICLVCYFLLPERFKKIFLLVSSYYFYMSWNPKYIILILLSTFVDYFAGIKLSSEENQKKRNFLLLLSLSLNLGLLFYFKYLNFAFSAIVDFANSIGSSATFDALDIILPVGISFYTFQTMSYTIDVYYQKREAESNFLDFALYVCYFPQLVAGPIERSTNLLPQIKKKSEFKYENFSYGFRMIIWGLFKKMVIADTCAPYVDNVFGNIQVHSSLTLYIAMYMFIFQVYCDFSGYSDIAIGVSRLFDIKLMDNFKAPLLAKSMGELWRRWHISLTTWLNDYVFFNLQVKWRHYKKQGLIAAIFVTFVLSGVWHGANWNFILWGFIHFVYLAYEAIFPRNKKVPNWMKHLIFIHLWGVACIIFRVDSVTSGLLYLKKLLFDFSFGVYSAFDLVKVAPAILILVIGDIFLDKESFGNKLSQLSRPARYAIYIFLIHFILQNGSLHGKSFIYFQF